MKVVAGQRWASASESDLGLGLVTSVEGRRLGIAFPAAEEQRTYAIGSAPLTRIRYGTGDSVRDLEDRPLRIESVEEIDGLIVYHCLDENEQQVRLPEQLLSPFVQFTSPLQRVQSGQFDRNADFALRLATLEHAARLAQSPLRGLLGCRTELLPHQIHIASEVAKRHAPRVLLADEVGLGKTIEAGMILHHQISTHQAQRVLIIVPDSLLHQWLVEMLRRFNLRFALFDSGRISAMLAEGSTNPFDDEQLVLCGTGLIGADEVAGRHAEAAAWDIVIVDEAHHLRWSAGGEPRDEAERAYACVETLAGRSPGLLLLTATPEQLGARSHFARLRLLDPARFHDFEEYVAGEKGYRQLGQAVAPLLEAEPLSASQRDTLQSYLDAPLPAELDEATRRRLLRRLLDQHGTGRVMFRNTRLAIPDFPPRDPRPAPLDARANDTPGATLEHALYPELNDERDDWPRRDARAVWLVKLIKSRPLDKFLIICHRRDAARTLDRHLTLREGIRSTSFYEDLSIIERDRAAAYFAEGQDDPGGGAQALVCSEVGSEGRNFQFAQHLVLFDLPLSPDLLEQRIGRLDRIGRQAPIHIHIPYERGTAREVLFRWYADGVGIFDKSFSAGQALMETFAARLHTLLLKASAGIDEVEELIADTRQFVDRSRRELKEGRDRLLELNSNDPDRAEVLIDRIVAEEASGALAAYADKLFDRLGVEQEYHSEAALILRPGPGSEDHMPGLDSDGTTVTFQRRKALAREDMAYLSWEHPLIRDGMESLIDGELGNAALASVALKRVPAGTVLVEAIFNVGVVAPRTLRMERFLDSAPLRYLIMQGGHDVSASVSADQLQAACRDVPPEGMTRIAEHLRPTVEALFEKARMLASDALPEIRDRARDRMWDELGGERDRLRQLAAVNPGVRSDEIEFFETRLQDCEDALERASVRPQAMRVVVNNPG